MRLKFLLLLVVSFALICDVAYATKDRKKNKNKHKHDDPTEEDEERRAGGGLSVSEDKRKETKDRVKEMLERKEDVEQRHEKKEESSEEKDDEKRKDEKNSTEIIIPKGRFRRHHHQKIEQLLHRQRREHSLKKTSEINDGAQTALENKPKQDHQCGPNCDHGKRNKREHSLSKTEVINDGQQTPLENKPKQDHQCTSIRCSHKRSTEEEQIADGVMITGEEGSEISLIRTRRAKGGKKDIGHRVASHPHGNKKNGIKAGRRRGSNGASKPRGNKDKASKKSKRHLLLVQEKESPEEPFQNEQDLHEHIMSRIYGDEPTSGRHLVRRSHRSVTHEELDHKKEHKKYPQHSDATVVSADAATITEI